MARVTLTGLAGHAEWDAVADLHGTAAHALVFDGEFDRVYAAAPTQSMHLQALGGALTIEHSPSWADVVVWNPGATQGAALPDMPSDGYRHMLCVEAAQVFEPITVHAGSTWQGWQQLRVA